MDICFFSSAIMPNVFTALAALTGTSYELLIMCRLCSLGAPEHRNDADPLFYYIDLDIEILHSLGV